VQPPGFVGEHHAPCRRVTHWHSLSRSDCARFAVAQAPRNVALADDFAEHRIMRGWLLVAAVVVGCGDSYAYKQTDAEQCEEMVTAVCARNVECAVMLGKVAQADATARQMTCEANIHSGLSCAGVYRVTKKDACEADVRNTPCSSWDPRLGALPEGGIPVPPSCVVEVPATT
jgi:hypothetical protein